MTLTHLYIYKIIIWPKRRFNRYASWFIYMIIVLFIMSSVKEGGYWLFSRIFLASMGPPWKLFHEICNLHFLLGWVFTGLLTISQDLSFLSSGWNMYSAVHLKWTLWDQRKVFTLSKVHFNHYGQNRQKC